MSVRMPVVAGAFYPQQASACRKQVEDYLAASPAVKLTGPVVAGIVPHAGWIYSGATAARVYALVFHQPVDTVVVLGAVHRWGINTPSVYPSGAWRTPLGDIEIDSELGEALVTASHGLVAANARAHADEHSIEVQVPFIQVVAPLAKLLPVAVPPEAEALEIGSLLAGAAQRLQRKVVVIASSDLTHYGPSYGYAPVGIGSQAADWARNNDMQLLDLAAAFQPQKVMAIAERQHSACGAGAIAGAVGYAQAAGATQGLILQHTTSAEVIPSSRPNDFVGYGAVVFV
ncbi:MAG: AmmeMemoRadiSam system protein B [Anaerolineae bacterium]